jgi:hypothetical protein
MALIIEGLYSGDWLKGEVEVPSRYSRDQVTLDNSGGGSALTLVSGAVLGKVTLSGNFVQLAPGASDGSQNVAGILLYNTTVAAASTAAVAIISREATVADTQITWPAGITTNQKNAAVAQLAALGIIVRRTA